MKLSELPSLRAKAKKRGNPKAKAPCSLVDCIGFRLRAHEALLRKPAREWIQRPQFTGDMVWSFGLPLDLCIPQDSKLKAASWKYAKIQRDLFRLMSLQLVTFPAPRILPGRPQVLAIRFSSVPTDRFSDWAKQPIDLLQRPMMRAGRSLKRLGLIYSDSPERADVHQWWEPAPRGYGFCYIEVRG